MREKDPIRETIKASQARQQWSRLLNEVFRRKIRVVVEKSGIPVAAIISASDLEQLAEMEAQRAKRFTALDATRAAFADVPDEELEAEVAKAVASARRKLRTERAVPPPP